MDIKIIKTEEDYKEALKMVESLILMDINAGSAEADKLQLLTTLIEDYEKNNFPSSLPDPVEAIKFRMEQLGLNASDMVHYIGSKSKVSEVLSEKTPLTLKMIRTLEKELGIPAKVLIQTSDVKQNFFENLHLDIIKELKKRGYLGNSSTKEENRNSIVSNFFAPLTHENLNFSVMLRQTNYRTSPTTNKQALAAWLGCVLHKASKVKILKPYRVGTVNLNFMRELVQLSTQKDAPLLVQSFLKDHGITLVIEKHFEKTKLDGAAIMFNKDNPIIGLTLRYDRIDSFWFTLMHELAHIALHLDKDSDLFYDELDDVKGLEVGVMELEADQLASEALVNSEKWEISPAKILPSKLAAESLSKELGVHIAIIAGKMRFEMSDFKRLSKVVGDAKVRHYFSEAFN
jgi:HTH-type transcriptional regulator/antitoxin HigA